MKAVLFLWLAAIFIMPVAAKEKPKSAADEGRKVVRLTALTAPQQEALLVRRRSGGMLGTFNSFASLLYAMDDIVVHSDDRKIGEVALNSPFPDFYKPTSAELFNAIARQTASSWSYDAKRAYWVFAKPAMPMPFKITLAKGWESEERGNYLFCKPPGAPVGMDIYVMAEFSSEPADPGLPAKMREAAAIMFARGFKKEGTAADMSTVKVGAYDSLHFKTPTPRPGTTWRQWAIAEAGQVVVIVSAIDDGNEKEVLPGVEEALRSFELKKHTPVQGD